MAPIMNFTIRKVLVLHLALFLFTSLLLSACSESQLQSNKFHGRRRMLAFDDGDVVVDKPKNKITTLPTKNQTKLIKPISSSKNQTKISLPNLSTKNDTKLSKPTNSTTEISLKKLNSTTPLLKKLNSTSKSSNFIKPSSNLTKKSSDLVKDAISKNKTSTKQTQTLVDKKPTKSSDLESDKPKKIQSTDKKPKQKTIVKPSWIDDEDEDDLVTEFRDLPTRFQKTLIPDLERFSTTSKAYITKANTEITKGFKPIVGKKYASTIASIVSCAFLLIPLLLVSLIFNKIKAYFSLQKILIFIQIYLSIYFSILCLSTLVTGLEPLKFFYATSKSTYICLQVLQTLGYVLYLLLLLMYLILVFSTNCGLGPKLLGLTQTLVGLAIGLHYYVSVFHRAVLNQPPKTNWKIHGIYATCYLVICLFANAERRKKAYLEDGGEEGKKN